MKKLPLFLLGLMACLAIGVTTAQGQIYKYSLEDLGVVTGMEASQPAAMNNLTHITGTAYKGQQTCAFFYDYTKKSIEDAGGLNSRGFGISSTNTVVGDAFFISTASVSHAAILQGGFAKDLGVLKGQTFSRANGINAIGQVVGFSGQKRDSSESRAFMWSGPTGMIDIGTLGGLYAQANAINDAGFITGWAQTQGLGPMTTTHAFIYQRSPGNQPMRDLGVLGGLSSYGMAINNVNHVVGYSTIGTNDPRVHAFLHDGSRMIDLGSLSAGSMSKSNSSVALGVNKLDQVVGFTYLPAVGETAIQQVAFLWTGYTSRDTGKMVNLNTLLNDTGRNYLLLSAVAINDNGQILASAYNVTDGGSLRAVLLTPVRPPVNH